MRTQRLVLAILSLLLLSGCASTGEGRFKVESQATRVESWNNVAREYIRMGQYEGAKRPLRRSLDIDPDNAMTLGLLALVFQQQGEYPVAEDYFRNALDAGPKNPTIANNYGIFLMMRGREEEACRYFDIAAQQPLYVERVQAMTNLASCYQARGRPEKAKALYKRVLDINPQSARALVELSEAALEVGDTAQAWAFFNRFRKQLKNKSVQHNAQSLWLGVRLSRLSGDPGMAAAYALVLKNDFPDSAQYRRYKESRQ